MPTVALVGTWLTTIGITSTAAAAVVTFAIDAIINFGIGKLIQKLSGTPQQFAQNYQTLTVKNTIASRTIIYGQVATSGVVIWEGTTGDHGQFLWFVIALAGHQCEEISDVWIDADRIPAADINASTGAVSTAKFNGKLKIWKKLGPASEIVLPDLNDATIIIDGNHIGLGVTKLIVRCEQDSTVFASGPPQTIRGLVKGKRVYDPRKDSTNGGSGSHRLTDATTWEYSANPTLCAADYLHGGSVYFDVATPVPVLGVGLTTDRVNWPFASASANTCDEDVTVPTADLLSTTTQKRYLLGLVLSCGDPHDTNLGKILATNIGQRVWVSGKYRLYAGTFDIPSASIDDDDLTAAGYSIQGALAQTDLYNQVSATYYDPLRDWQQEPCAVRQEDTFIAEDGLPILRTVALDGVTDEFRAQRICEVTVRQSRNQIAPILNCKLSADKVAPWETFNLTLIEEGWTNKVFRALGINADLGARSIQITCKEETAAAYTDPVAADYAAPGQAAPTNTIERPGQPSGLQATGIQDGIVFTWTAPAYFPVGAAYELYERASVPGPFSGSTLVAKGLSVTTVTIYKADTTERYYWILAKSAQGQASDQFPLGNGIAGHATSNSAVFSVTASPASLSTTVTTSTATTGSTTVTPTNGTAPFTYAWTWSTGGTGITITSASSASTTFSATSLTAGTTRTGQALCTVTDNGSVVRTTTVSVSISCISTALAATVSPSTVASSFTTASQTTPSAVVTAMRGTPGYTYAWTWQSGGSFITITSTTATSTTFSATGLSDGEVRTGTAQCVVTDSASATVTVTVSVRIVRRSTA